MVSGAVAGLGAITPCAGYVGPLASIVIGVIAGILCYKTMLWRIDKGMDESLDAWSVHGIGGLWGTIAVGIFASAAINGYTGLLYGNVNQFLIQIAGALLVMVYAFGISFILAKIIDLLMGLRVTEEEEYVGLDLSQHGERA
jgi:Amt family ammonium transporter